MKILIDLYEMDSEKFAFLDPSSVDGNNNTLLHLVAKTTYNKHVLRVTEYLSTLQIPSDIQNKEGKTALQYIKDKNDKRTSFLKVVVSRTGKKNNSKSKKKGSKKMLTKGIEITEINESNTSTKKVQVTQNKVENLTSCKDRIRKLIQYKLQNESKNPNRKSITPKKGQKENCKNELDSQKKKSRKDGAIDIILDFKDETETETETESESSSGKLNKSIDYDDDVELLDITDDDFLSDVDSFDNLEWEVECTADVWKQLQDKHILPELKRRAIKRIQMLASGEWRPYLTKRIMTVPSSLKLFEAKLSKGARIFWELAIAFSPRCSEVADRRLGTDNDDADFAVKGGKIYSEIIRVWDIVLDHDNINKTIEKITKSHSRGETCILQKKLKGIKDAQFEGSSEKRLPIYFAEIDQDIDLEAIQEQQRQLYPPASAKETEYHILKFYSFTSTLVNHILNNIDSKVDFPFRVTDTEHAIINLKSKAPILLLGRSGTGKTTCCLYRLWSMFVNYWTKAKEANSSLLPRNTHYLMNKEVDDDGLYFSLYIIFIY